MKAIKDWKRNIWRYRELILIGTILCSSSMCNGAENRGAIANYVDQINDLSSFDADKFVLSGCNSTLLKDMKKRNVVPKSKKWEDEEAYEYESADATIWVPKYPSPGAVDDDSRISLFYSIVTNLEAYDFTRPFHGKALSEVEGFFKAKYEGSRGVGYTVDQIKKSITLHTEAADVELHSDKAGIYRADFQCDNSN